MLCDLTPPEIGDVYDGLLYEDDMTTPRDEVYSSKPATVSGQWENFVDPESDIAEVQISVIRKHADK